MSDLAALTDRAVYLARLATTADESVGGLDARVEQLTAELAATKDARAVAATEAKAAHKAAADADAELAAAQAAAVLPEGDVAAQAGVAKGSAR